MEPRDAPPATCPVPRKFDPALLMQRITLEYPAEGVGGPVRVAREATDAGGPFPISSVACPPEGLQVERRHVRRYQRWSYQRVAATPQIGMIPERISCASRHQSLSTPY